MTKALVRYDLTLPHYFGYAPAPIIETRPVIPRREPKGLFMRGEIGTKEDGNLRPIVAHNTTHLDVPYHFIDSGDDLAAVLNRPDLPCDRPCLAYVANLAHQPDLPGSHTRDGVTYCEAVSAKVLPAPEVLRPYEALVLLTGFAAISSQRPESRFTPEPNGGYHVPHLTDSAVDLILASGIRLVALDSTTVEPQTGQVPVRFGSDIHFRLLGHEPPVMIVEGIGGAALKEQVGFVPHEALLHVIPRRVNAAGADAAHARVFLHFYRDDPRGEALRQLAQTVSADEYHG